MIPNPRHLIVTLLIGAEGEPISARDAVAACGLFGIRENSVRVALVRLSAAGMIEAEARGTYRLGRNAVELADNVQAWRAAESRVRTWSGKWIAVYSGALGRSDRAALRPRDRALALLGFRELDRGLFLRPDNLVGGVADVRARLYKLGLDPEAAVFILESLDDEREAHARSRWNGKALTRSYVQGRQRLEDWLAKVEGLDLEVLARESFLLGNETIRQVVFDPLLPDPLVDVDARRAFLTTLIEFDRVGHTIWRELASRRRAHVASEGAYGHH
jgi:phenylacetic acid degradation operon negative regulatory protein